MEQFKQVICIALALSSYWAYSQSNEMTSAENEGAIVISEKSLSSLAEKLSAYKISRKAINEQSSTQNDEPNDLALQMEIDLLTEKLKRLSTTQPTNVTVQPSAPQNDVRSDYNYERIKRLQKELDYLNDRISDLRSRRPNSASTVVVPEQTVLPNQVDNQDNNLAYEKLKGQLDSLALALKNDSETELQNQNSEEFDSLKDELSKISNQIKERKEEPAYYRLLLEKYGSYKKNIYFANNSTKINVEAKQILDNLYEVLGNNENIDVILKGFASDKGSIGVNERLSLLRTEEVKKALVRGGIHPTRILTQYHGIDYESNDESNARRVEVSFLIRK